MQFIVTGKAIDAPMAPPQQAIARTKQPSNCSLPAKTNASRGSGPTLTSAP
jgi:hypothetical protein